MKEYYYDKLFNIQTNGKGVFTNNSHYFPYEPTPYQALELLFEQYEVRSNDQFVDFGCGLGRLNFFIHYHFHASVTGIEMNEVFYKKAIQNRDHYAKKTKYPIQKLDFQCSRAEEYHINSGDNRFYFFNPFSVHIFQHIVNRILQSVEEFPREVDILLYYPSEDYIFYLENQTMFQLEQEIILPYETNPNERFLIYRFK